MLRELKPAAKKITPKMLTDFENYLIVKERAESTREKYMKYIRQFAAFLGGSPVTMYAALQWKKSLEDSGEFQATTINVKLSAVNAFFKFLGRKDLTVELLRIQRQPYRDSSRDLTKEDYWKLVDAAKRLGLTLLALILEALGSTGCRVSELRNFTVEKVKTGRVQIHLKGKVRTILLLPALTQKLLNYAEENEITAGPIFLNMKGTAMDRHQVWAAMKALCEEAGLEESKVFPHNLRHMFAVEYYEKFHDVAKLADLLGHSSIATTRIYLIGTGEEHLRQLEQLDLVRED